MTKLRNILYRIYTPLVDASPEIFLSILKRKHLNIILDRMEIGLSYNWESQKLPSAIKGFEDLSFLFWSTPINRGIIRQDFDEASALYRTISNIKNPLGVEIGRFSGGSTILLASALGETGKLISIDIRPQNDDLLTSILDQYGFLGRVQLIKGDANDILLNEDWQYDFVFIDGDHSYEGAKRDHNKWGSKVKTNGYIIHHDMGLGRIHATQHSALARLKNDILQIQANEMELLFEVGSMCFFRKRSSNWTPL